jgi:peroxiredoxin
MRSVMLGLLIFVASEQPRQKTPKEHLESIQEAQKEASQQYYKEWHEAKTEEQRQIVIAGFLAKVVVNADRALDLARHHSDDPTALDALIFVIRTAGAGPSDRSERAIEMMAHDYVRDEKMGDLCQRLLNFSHLPAAENLIRTVLDQNPSRTARGLACHALAHYLDNQARTVRRLRENPEWIRNYEQSRGKVRTETLLREKDPNTLEEEAAKFLERVVSAYGTVEYGQRTLAEIAEGELFERRHLKIGEVAPEIDGEDVDGKRLKLSDYRGKVIVLTFSGNWCGPCRAMYPHERKLIERLKDKPFVLLSVNTDEGKETLRKSIASGEITWRCWCDGGSEGPISTKWGVQGFPTVYVLDAEGVIRFRNVRDDRLDKAVETLLEKMEPEQKP